MALSKANKTNEFDPSEAYPVTDQAPAQDDQTAAVVGDASHEDSPVRTARPDVPIAAAMAGGVGQHRPPNPDEFDRDGRPIGDIKVADNTDAEARDTRGSSDASK